MSHTQCTAGPRTSPSTLRNRQEKHEISQHSASCGVDLYVCIHNDTMNVSANKQVRLLCHALVCYIPLSGFTGMSTPDLLRSLTISHTVFINLEFPSQLLDILIFL